MNYRFITAAVLALSTVGVSAQTADKPVSLEPAHSPFTYEVLGATPSLRLTKRVTPTDEAKVAMARDKRQRTVPEASRQNESPTSDRATRSKDETKQ